MQETNLLLDSIMLTQVRFGVLPMILDLVYLIYNYVDPRSWVLYH